MRRVPFVLTVALCLGPASSALASVTVLKDAVNVRSGPGTNHPVVLTAKQGQTFEDISQSGDWFKIKLGGDKIGYISASLVLKESVAAPNTVAITKGAMNVRSGPGTNYPVVGKAQNGAVLPVISTTGTWAKVQYGSGTAWVASYLCTVKTLDAKEFQAGDLDRKVLALKSVSVRRGASEDYDVLVTMKQGARADYLGSSDGWHRVKTASGTIGWVDATDVKVFNADAGQGVSYEVTDDTWEMRVTPQGVSKGNANVRKSGTTSSAIVGKLTKGKGFTVLGSQNGWYNIQYGNVTGWVASYLVTVNPVQGPSTVRLERRQTDRILTLTGQFPQASLAMLDPKNLAIIAYPRAGTRGSLEVYSAEIAGLQIGQAGILLSFSERPYYQVIENKPNRLSIRFSSNVEAIAYADPSGPARTAISLNILGYIEPEISYNPEQTTLTLNLPGTSAAALAPLAANGSVERASAQKTQAGTSVTVKLAPGAQYNLKRSANNLTVETSPKGLSGKVIVLDPGHGGGDPGALSASRTLQEKQPNLDIALKLKQLLEARGARVIMTRTQDSQGPTLADRIKLSLDSRPDLFVSIHNNSNTNRTKSGTSVYFAESSLNAERSRVLSRMLQTSLLQNLGTQDMGVRSAEFYVCRNAPVAAALAEVVFISNPEEEAKLKDQTFLASAAQALYNGLRQYFND